MGISIKSIGDKVTFRSKIKGIKDGMIEKYEVFNDSVLFYQQQRYYKKLAEMKNVSYEEAVKLCETDPECSLGLKLADPDNVALTLTRKGKEKFKLKLTPEELEIFKKDENKNFKRGIRQAKKGVKE